MTDLGDRIKRYEYVTRNYLTRRIPVVIRLDGRAFHTLTHDLDKPFDKRFIETMILTATKVCEDIQGFKLAYIQSDEINILLTDYDRLESEGWFDYNLSKIISVSSGLASAYFTSCWDKIGIFDSRAFNIPADEVSNYFVWRAKDWVRNSLQMYARSFFSHKQLMNKCSSDIHEMLHNINKNWANDLDNRYKNGTYIIKTDTGLEYFTHIVPNYYEIEKLWRSNEN